jgi:hypothetical protein
MTPQRRSFVLVAWLVLLFAPLAQAQTDRARLMGLVTDGSGGALPGVTVTLQSRPVVSVVTDGNGRYITPWLTPGAYTITFVLSGFETRTVANVPLDAGQTIVLDQQLPIEKLTETVEVTAPAPKPPPQYRPPPKPQPRPVDKETLASVCGPRQATDFTIAIGKIVSHRDDPNRQLIGPGDVLRIDAGEKQGVAVGQNFVVRRKFQTGDRLAPKKIATFAEQTAGMIQVVETQADSASAVVVYLCGELYAGDSVEPVAAQPVFVTIPTGAPQFEEPAKIVTGEHGQSLSADGQMMVIDRGIMQGVQRGQRVTIFRRTPGTSSLPVTIGDGVIIAVRADSATLLIDHVTDAVMVGDLVALHR